jgi:hypothetical protein
MFSPLADELCEVSPATWQNSSTDHKKNKLEEAKLFVCRYLSLALPLTSLSLSSLYRGLSLPVQAGRRVSGWGSNSNVDDMNVVFLQCTSGTKLTTVMGCLFFGRNNIFCVTTKGFHSFWLSF